MDSKRPNTATADPGRRHGRAYNQKSTARRFSPPQRPRKSVAEQYRMRRWPVASPTKAGRLCPNVGTLQRLSLGPRVRAVAAQRQASPSSVGGLTPTGAIVCVCGCAQRLRRRAQESHGFERGASPLFLSNERITSNSEKSMTSIEVIFLVINWKHTASIKVGCVRQTSSDCIVFSILHVSEMGGGRGKYHLNGGSS